MLNGTYRQVTRPSHVHCNERMKIGPQSPHTTRKIHHDGQSRSESRLDSVILNMATNGTPGVKEEKKAPPGVIIPPAEIRGISLIIQNILML